MWFSIDDKVKLWCDFPKFLTGNFKLVLPIDFRFQSCFGCYAMLALARKKIWCDMMLRFSVRHCCKFSTEFFYWQLQISDLADYRC